MCDDQLPSAGPSVGAGCDALCPIGNDTCGSDGYLLVYESLQTVEVISHCFSTGFLFCGISVHILVFGKGMNR